MTLPRGLLLIALVGAIGISVVLLRQSMAACSHRIQQQHQHRVRLEQALWTRQMELARLRMPTRLRERVENFGLEIAFPKIERKVTRNGPVRTHD